MKIVRNAGAVMFGILPLLVGCAQPGRDAGDEDVGVVKQAGGNETKNGFDHDIANDCWDDVLQAMSLPLVVSGALNPALPETVKPGEKCEAALRYAFRCAGEQDTTLPVPAPFDPDLYTGDEVMSTALDWPESPLTNAQKRDVLQCMITLVNDQEVDVCLSGANVSSGACLSFGVEEAVWRARLTRDGGVDFDIWPLDPVGLCPEGSVASVLQSRFCAGVSPTSCMLQVRNDLASACTESNGEYDCGGPAVKTTLSIGGYLAQYPGCYPPPQ